MLVGILITCDVIVCFLLIFVVLMQSGKGGVSGAFGIGGASQTIFGAGQAGNVMTKATWILGGSFMALSFLIALMGSPTGGRQRQSILQPNARPTSSQAPASQVPGSDASLPTATPPAGGEAGAPAPTPAPIGNAPTPAPVGGGQ